MSSETGIERVNYFQGQMLSASDLQAEQEYILARHRRHNRYLHGWGVVCGLTVSMGSSSEIIVEPGFAIDCAGNEIHVCTQSRLAVPNAPQLQFVVVQYSETQTTPIPLASGTGNIESEQVAYTRIREAYQIDILDVDPTSGHRRKRTGTPGCGSPHPVCIARLRKSSRGWKVEGRGRRRRR